MPRPGVVSALTLALVLSAPLAARDAHAYVQYKTSDGTGWSWQGTNCMPIAVYPLGFQDMTANEVTAASVGAAAAWSALQNPCTYLTLNMRITIGPTPNLVPRRLAVLVFRNQRWCKVIENGSCSQDAADVSVYDESVLVLTSSEVDERTGAMTRAGIEVNAVDFRWADLELHPELAAGTQDLQNALTHELGHFIGLDHNCSPTGANPAPVDDLGAPAPECDTAPAYIAEATMFPTAPEGDLQKRTLAADDERALCDIYPIKADPKVCSPPWDHGGGCACAAASAPPSATGVLGALGTLLVGAGVGLRRRRSATRVMSRRPR